MMDFPYAWGPPPGGGRIRAYPEDFQVREILPFEPCGEGEHLFLYVCKRNATTRHVQARLARFFKVRDSAVGYAGLKDKHAVTQQWFSVHLPGIREHALPADDSEMRVLQATRHNKKLKIGYIRENQFEIIVRELSTAHDALETRLQTLKAAGMPNYFGEQRFGREKRNVEEAIRVFREGKRIGKHKRGLYLSSLRSFVFNQILGRRIALDQWNKVLPGDVMTFDDGGSLFSADEQTAADPRLDGLQIHPTGALVGCGKSPAASECLILEEAVVAEHESIVNIVQNEGVAASRRALRVKVRDLRWRFQGEDVVTIQFALPKGCYATSLLRELLQYDELVSQQ